ncbi:MAG: glycosyltransferase family 4 protein [Flavobacteriales bacterium]|nr:glycosyltransferase family 4 protein [Flavobacteriales bacterium]
MKRICYIVSDIDRSLAFEWIVKNLDSKRFHLRFILLNPGPSALEKYLIETQVPFIRINADGSLGLISAWIQVWWHLLIHRPHIVHCHMRKAKLIGISASFLSLISRRIYTRHSADYNHKYHPHAVKYDRLVNTLSTDIVAISKNVEEVLTQDEKAAPQKIHRIPHGFDLKGFQEVDARRILALKTKWELEGDRTCIGVISRMLELKGFQYIIPAIARLQKQGVKCTLVIANARGPYLDHVKRLIAEHALDDVRLIPFEHDIQALYHCFDIFLHTPIDRRSEAFGQTYVEGLAAGIPSVFTLSGVAPEFITDSHNALVVPHCDKEAISDAIQRLLEDEHLRSELSRQGKESVKIFALDTFIQRLESLYGH